MVTALRATEVEAFLAAYAAAYERLDGDAVAAHCGLPLAIAQGGRLHGFADLEALRDNMRQLCAVYAQAGLQRAEPRVEQLSLLGAHDAFVLVHWRLWRADGSLLQAFRTGYQMQRQAGALRVFFVTAFDEDLAAMRGG